MISPPLLRWNCNRTSIVRRSFVAMQCTTFVNLGSLSVDVSSDELTRYGSLSPIGPSSNVSVDPPICHLGLPTPVLAAAATPRHACRPTAFLFRISGCSAARCIRSSTTRSSTSFSRLHDVAGLPSNGPASSVQDHNGATTSAAAA